MRQFLRPGVLGLLAALGLAVVGLSCRKPVEQLRPNLVLISIDTLRADHLTAYGYERSTSPEISRLANEGVLFEQAFSQPSQDGDLSHVVVHGSLPAGSSGRQLG